MTVSPIDGADGESRHWTTGSPIGPLTLIGAGGRLTRLMFPGEARAIDRFDDSIEDREPFAAVIRQLEEYFSGRRRIFDLALAPRGTPFQKAVWQELMRIPYGETRSYGQIAAALGRAGASRAVGAANGRNPIPIIVPCHRVIGADGSLTGFGGGLEAKRWLLQHEGQRAMF